MNKVLINLLNLNIFKTKKKKQKKDILYLLYLKIFSCTCKRRYALLEKKKFCF